MTGAGAGSGRWGGYPVATGIVAIHGPMVAADLAIPRLSQRIIDQGIGRGDLHVKIIPEVPVRLDGKGRRLLEELREAEEELLERIRVPRAMSDRSIRSAVPGSSEGTSSVPPGLTWV